MLSEYRDIVSKNEHSSCGRKVNIQTMSNVYSTASTCERHIVTIVSYITGVSNTEK